MAYKAIFWKLSPKYDPSLLDSAGVPQGDGLWRSVHVEKQRSEHLIDFDSAAFIRTALDIIPDAHQLPDGRFEWNGANEDALILTHGPQHVQVTSFDAPDEILFRIFDLADEFNLTHFDWGN